MCLSSRIGPLATPAALYEASQALSLTPTTTYQPILSQINAPTRAVNGYGKDDSCLRSLPDYDDGSGDPSGGT